MRRLVLSVLAAVVALGGTLAFSAAPVGAEGLVDLSAVTTSRPAAVSPPGALAYYTATFQNEGALPVDAVLKNTTSGGTVLSFAGDSTCARSGNVVTCTDNLAAGEKKVVEVVVQSPSTAPAVITNTSTARLSPSVVQAVDLYPVNDSSSVSTPVQASSIVGSAGFVPEGGSLPFKKHNLTVLDAEVGVLAFLKDTPAVQTLNCGGEPCQNGLNVDFQDGDQGEQFYGLVEVAVNFGVLEPCRGNGNPDCHPLFFKKPGQPVMDVPDCGAGVPMPCEAGFSKANGEFTIRVRFDTDDPDLLTPVKNLSGGSV